MHFRTELVSSNQLSSATLSEDQYNFNGQASDGVGAKLDKTKSKKRSRAEFENQHGIDGTEQS